MSQDTSTFILGAVIFVVLIPVIYVVARVITMIGDAGSAHLLAPLAPAIGGTVDRNQPCIRGRYQGRDVRVSFTPGQSVGSGDSATAINAFYVEVLDLPGRQDWRIKFHLSGLLGQGPKQLTIEVQDKALGERLEQSEVLSAVAAVSTPTQPYVTVAYEARQKTLTYTDDMTPRQIPSRAQFTAQLELVARLAEVNDRVNP
ncbi:hypothetical protein TFLX_05914 [Thermoflexales bacterium]|nr:hypothetical protein TFLX_05914 [Thermoflexales bacterium]